MINDKKVGVGIVTYNRFDLFNKCYDSIKDIADIDHIVVVNDGESYNWKPSKKTLFVEHSSNLGVGKSKNEALKFLLDAQCDHIFLIEDDIFVKNPEVFKEYIKASNITGIQHFNFSQHGVMNKMPYDLKTPAPKLVLDYGSIKVPLYPHCVGAFSYYSRLALETVGLLDERYYNACEHVDHTYDIIKAGMHPPFWNFADIDNSMDYIGDEQWSIQQSTITSSLNHSKIIADADRVFFEKHGHYPGGIPILDDTSVMLEAKRIKKEYEKR